MGVTPTNSDSSAAQVTNQINSVARDVQAMQTVQLFKDETGVRRVLLGRQADGSYGLKVSQPTFDVYEATNDDLIFNSSQNVFKIVQSGTATMGDIVGNSTTSVNVSHGLGFAPIPLVFWDGGSSYMQLPFFSAVTTSGVDLALDGWFFASVSSTDLTISCSSATYTTSTDTTFKYYLLQETAN